MDNIVIDGRLASRPTVSEIEGRLVAHLTLLVTTVDIYRFESWVERYEVIAYDEEAKGCRNLRQDESLRVKGWLRTTSEGEHDGQHASTEVVATRLCVAPWLWGSDDDEEETEDEVG